MPINMPGLWFMSWYDVSVGPNLAMYNHVRKTARPEVANQQWAVIAPVGHCAYTRATEHTIVGERDMGDARLNYTQLVNSFFDRFVKGVNDGVLDTLPKVIYYTMGTTSGRRRTRGRRAAPQPMTFYLGSGGNANTLNGDGVLATKRRRPTSPTSSPTTR